MDFYFLGTKDGEFYQEETIDINTVFFSVKEAEGFLKPYSGQWNISDDIDMFVKE